jgi:transcriptional/translational regulatory protein YebC/TACO1
MFHRKGLVVIAEDQTDEETLFELALEAGAEDVKREGDKYAVVCDPEAFSDVCQAIDRTGIATEIRQLTRLPQDTIDLDTATARKVLQLMEKLDDHDDVQNISANFNIPDEAMAELEK